MGSCFRPEPEGHLEAKSGLRRSRDMRGKVEICVHKGVPEPEEEQLVPPSVLVHAVPWGWNCSPSCTVRLQCRLSPFPDLAGTDSLSSFMASQPLDLPPQSTFQAGLR
jgi:hypothetical protein